ncbi:MAG: hypothetical protein KDI06_06935 [Calditrichaeota bacterium]|nr:hypothetical protein [Calditrichota bacterium]HQU73034.1 hypothetical protein [Calditrichia bacterium]
MKRFMSVLMVAMMVAMAFFSACSDDSTTPEDNTPDPTVIEGSWLSDGSNVAPLLAGLGFASISASFASNNTYSVVATDTGGFQITFSGTYTAEASTVDGIFNITLNQSVPSAIVSEGIYEVDASMTPNQMRYEVVQTEPSLGTPPTAEAGFGSSAGGILGNSNIQVFVRQ